MTKLESSGKGSKNWVSPKANQGGKKSGKRVQFEKEVGGYSSNRHRNYASHLSPLQGKEKDNTDEALFVEDDSM